jgi:two-component system chemotaxis response regulator CheB
MNPPGVHTGWVVAIGASEGGAAVLREIVQRLPVSFPAAVCVVQHIGAFRSTLDATLDRCGPLPARFAQDGEALAPGRIYVAPPDTHLLVEPHIVRLSSGPKVNYTRPAVDPLFRTCALAHGPRVIGVVLTGNLDDGTAGLQDIKHCGGVAVVQDPATAEADEMPMSALINVPVDHCTAPEAIAGLLVELVHQTPGLRQASSSREHERIAREQDASEGRNNMTFICADTDPTLLTCPDCNGSLSQVRGSVPARYACHTGHAFSLAALAHAQHVESEHVLRAAVRALRERAMLLREVESFERIHGRPIAALQAARQSVRARLQADNLLRLIEVDPTEGADPIDVSATRS